MSATADITQPGVLFATFMLRAFFTLGELTFSETGSEFLQENIWSHFFSAILNGMTEELILCCCNGFTKADGRKASLRLHVQCASFEFLPADVRQSEAKTGDHISLPSTVCVAERTGARQNSSSSAEWPATAAFSGESSAATKRPLLQKVWRYHFPTSWMSLQGNYLA